MAGGFRGCERLTADAGSGDPAILIPRYAGAVMLKNQPSPATAPSAAAALVMWFRMKHITGWERCGRWMILIGLFLVMGPLVLGVTGLSRSITARFGEAMLALSVLVGIASLLGSWLVIRVGVGRRWRDAKARVFLSCLTCGYDLGTVAPVGVCPECGGPYDHAELPQRWVARWGHAPREGGRGTFRPGPPWVITASGAVRVPEEPKPARGERVGALLLTAGWIWLGVFGGRAVIRYSQMLSSGLSVRQWVGVAVIGAAAVAGGLTIITVTRRRIRRKLAAAGGRLCIGCSESLAGLADVGVCPACGKAFDAVELQWAWWRYGAMVADCLPVPGREDVRSSHSG